MTFPAVPLVGAGFTRRTTNREFALGTTAASVDGKSYIYTRAAEAVAIGTCTVNPTTFLLTDAAGNHTADVAFANNEYGWVRRTTSPY